MREAQNVHCRVKRYVHICQVLHFERVTFAFRPNIKILKHRQNFMLSISSFKYVKEFLKIRKNELQKD